MANGIVHSPIEVLLPAFQGAPVALAPERGHELQEIITNRNIEFRFDTATHEMRFEGQELFGGLGLVCVGIRGLERLWAHAFAAVHVYFRFQAGGFTEPLQLTETEEGMGVQRLLQWALEGEMEGNPQPWPLDIPRPAANPADDQHRVTNELFLGSAGFAVLHEIGHIVREHRGMNLAQDVCYRHEFEADEWAYDWVMEKWRDYDNSVAVYRKRATLIAALFALISVNHVYEPRRRVGSKHPNTVDRLLRFLVKHANEDSGLPVGLPWSVAGTTIHLHLSQVLEQPLPVMNSWRRYFGEIRDRLDQP